MAPDALREAVRPFLVGRGFDPEVEWLPRALEALRVRANTLLDLADGLAPFFAEKIEWDEKARRKNLKPAKVERLPDLATAIAGVEPWTAEALEAATEAWLAENDLALKKVGQPIRVAITGRAVSPPLFDTMEVLGREKVLGRLRDAPRIADEGGEETASEKP
jgi:glutamyl-tRNA synthetase